MAATQPRLEQRRLYAELWTSFVALIRSYVAANDLAKPVSNHALVDEGQHGRLTLRGEQKTLGLEFEVETGAGSWVVYEDEPGPERVLERGRFEMGADSRIVLSDRPESVEMDVAAEVFTAKVFD